MVLRSTAGALDSVIDEFFDVFPNFELSVTTMERVAWVRAARDRAAVAASAL